MRNYFVSVSLCLVFTLGLASNAFRSFRHATCRNEVARVPPCERGLTMVHQERTAPAGRNADVSTKVAQAVVQASEFHGGPMAGRLRSSTLRTFSVSGDHTMGSGTVSRCRAR